MEQEQVNEEDFYLERFFELKKEKRELDKNVKETTDWFKAYLTDKGIDNLNNERFDLTKSDSTATQINASDLMRELNIQIPKEIEESINELFNVNITNAKKNIGMLTLNKIAKEGKTTTTLRLKEKKNE